MEGRFTLLVIKNIKFTLESEVVFNTLILIFHSIIFNLSIYLLLFHSTNSMVINFIISKILLIIANLFMNFIYSHPFNNYTFFGAIIYTDYLGKDNNNINPIPNTFFPIVKDLINLIL